MPFKIKNKLKRSKYKKYSSFFTNHQQPVKKTHKNLLKSKYWYFVKRKVFAIRGNTCEVCRRSNTSLHIHHMSYKIMFNEHKNTSKLLVVCKKCHSYIHNKRLAKFACIDPYRNKSNPPSRTALKKMKII